MDKTDMIYWQLNFAQIRAFYGPTKEALRGTDLTISYLHLNKTTELNDDAEVIGTLVVTMPQKNNPGHCQPCSLHLWLDIFTVTRNRLRK